MNWRPHLAMAGLAGLLLAGIHCGWAAQTVPPVGGLAAQGGTAGAFRVPEYYDKPNSGKLRSLLTGTVPALQPDGTLRLATVRLMTFDLDGTTNLVFTGTNCLLDAKNRIVYSADRLEMRTGDERLYVSGTGFLFRQTNSQIIISNQVHTIIRGAPGPLSTLR
jgi:hypothetical protein